MVTVEEKLYEKMPQEIKSLFKRLPNPGSDEVLEFFPNTGPSKAGGRGKPLLLAEGEKDDSTIQERGGYNEPAGSAARFFYCAKENRSERWAYLTCNCETVKLDAWVKQDQNQEGLMGGMLQEVATSEKALTEDCSFSMSTSGKLKTEKSQKDTAFTTSTTINKTTGSKTYNSLAQQSTSDYTEDASLEEKNGGSHAQSAKDLNRSTPRIGTSHQRDGRCMGVVVPATSLESYRKSVCENCGGEVKVAAHPTQKPISLMRYLVKLVTPKGGTVLDPFTGSGSTGKACKLEGFNFIGVEREEEYVKIARARIEAVSYTPTLL